MYLSTQLICSGVLGSREACRSKTRPCRSLGSSGIGSEVPIAIRWYSLPFFWAVQSKMQVIFSPDDPLGLHGIRPSDVANLSLRVTGFWESGSTNSMYDFVTRPRGFDSSWGSVME